MEPLFTDAFDRLGRPFKYSPDGTRLAYLMNFDTTEDVPIPGGRLVMSDSSGKNPKFLKHRIFANLRLRLVSGRGRHCCGCSRCAWQLFGEKKTVIENESNRISAWTRVSPFIISRSMLQGQ